MCHCRVCMCVCARSRASVCVPVSVNVNLDVGTCMDKRIVLYFEKNIYILWISKFCASTSRFVILKRQLSKVSWLSRRYLFCRNLLQNFFSRRTLTRFYCKSLPFLNAAYARLLNAFRNVLVNNENQETKLLFQM